jgi:hypothetical protein
MGCHLAHLSMSTMVLMANMARLRFEVFAPFLDQGCISMCGDALYSNAPNDQDLAIASMSAALGHARRPRIRPGISPLWLKHAWSATYRRTVQIFDLRSTLLCPCLLNFLPLKGKSRITSRSASANEILCKRTARPRI